MRPGAAGADGLARRGMRPPRPSRPHVRGTRLLMLSRTLTRARCHVLCTQAHAVAVRGSYAYVAGQGSDSLVVIDISNPASPVIRGSVASSSLMDYVSVAWSCGPGSPRAPRHASAPSITLARPRRHRR